MQDMPPILILAGGVATRLGEASRHRPKSLVPVNGEPFLKRQLALLTASGFRDIIFCLGHLGQPIKDYIGNGEKFGIRPYFSDDGDKLLGTGGAVRKAVSAVTGKSDSVAMIYGDSYLKIDYCAVVEASRRSNKAGILTVFGSAVPGARFNTEVSGGLVTAFDKENPTESMSFIDYGFMVFDKEAVLALPEDRAFDLTLLFKHCAAKRDLVAFVVQERFYEVGTPEGIADLEWFLEETSKSYKT